MSPTLLLSTERQEQIRQISEAVLGSCKIDKVPVDIYQISAMLDFKVIKMFNNELSGAIDKTKKIIFISDSDADTRKRFTIAHELGHFVLNHGDVVDYRNKQHSDETKECEADEFAGNILMPRPWLYYFENKMKYNNEQLAVIFGVSESALQVRKNNVR